MLAKLNKRAQTTAEYAILIAIVVGAVVAMQVYLRRGINERIRNVVDHVGAGGSVGGGDNFAFTAGQYEPYYASSVSKTGRESSEQEVLGGKGEVGRGLGEQTVQKRQQVTGWSDKDVATVTGEAKAAITARDKTPVVAEPEKAP